MNYNDANRVMTILGNFNAFNYPKKPLKPFTDLLYRSFKVQAVDHEKYNRHCEENKSKSLNEINESYLGDFTIKVLFSHDPNCEIDKVIVSFEDFIAENNWDIGTIEIINSIETYLRKDTSYKFYPYDNSLGFQISSFATFEVTNVIPENHFAPFFKIKSIGQAKEIFKSVLLKHMPQTNMSNYDKKFDVELEKSSFNPSSELYFAVYQIR